MAGYSDEEFEQWEAEAEKMRETERQTEREAERGS